MSAAEHPMAEKRRDQAELAWKRSATVRQRTKMLREALKTRQVDPVRVIMGSADAPIEDHVKDMKLLSFLTCLPGVQMPRALDIIQAFDASPQARMRAFSHERREQLAYIYKGAVSAWSP